jgi:hypothetical protein
MPGIEPHFFDYPAYSLVTVGYLNATQPVLKSDIDQEPCNSCAPFNTALICRDGDLKPLDLD